MNDLWGLFFCWISFFVYYPFIYLNLFINYISIYVSIIIWVFLSLRVFELLSSSLLLFPQRFGWYFLRPSSGVCQTRGTFTKLRTTSFIESMGIACSDSISHNQVQMLSIPVLLFTCSQDWTCNNQMIVPLEA